MNWTSFRLWNPQHLDNTVKLVYKDHPRDQQSVILIHRWSLYAGYITWKVYPWGLVKCGLYKQVVFIYRWSLEQVQLQYILLYIFDKYLRIVILRGFTIIILYPYELLMALHMQVAGNILNSVISLTVILTCEQFGVQCATLPKIWSQSA